MNSSLILIADDDPDCRAVVSGALTMEGYQVIEAEDGDEALSKLRETEVDLAVLDVMMPGLNGNEVCRELKALRHGELVPVLMLTARDGLKEKVESLTGGADDYLTKPFHYQELQARVRALLRVRDLNVRLLHKNQELAALQKALVQKERQLAVMQLAGTAAHQLGQPLAAILLNCHLLETLAPTHDKYRIALQAVKQDTRRMAELIEGLKEAKAANTENYHGATEILKLD